MMTNLRSQLADLIINRLNENKVALKQQFFFEHPIKVARYFTLDNLLPIEMAEKISASFPKPSQMHLLNIYGKLRLKYSHLREVSSLLQDINFAIQNPKVVAVVEEITEIKNQISDPTQYAGGISTFLKGHYLNPHLDLSHDIHRKNYRTVNVLYYLSPNWQLGNGGNLELWDTSIKNRIVIPNFFNRLVVMETNRISWHGVNRVLCDAPRCCVFNYYFSEQSPEGEDYFFKRTTYRARPEQKIRRVFEFVKNTFLRDW